MFALKIFDHKLGITRVQLRAFSLTYFKSLENRGFFVSTSGSKMVSCNYL